MANRLPGGQSAVRRHARLALVCAGVGLSAVWIAPYLAPHDPLIVRADLSFLGPSSEYPLGTDALGRCTLSRLLSAAPVSLVPVFAVTAVEIGLGTLIGGLAGYVGGRFERLVMAVIDAMLSFPSVLLVLGVTGLLGPGLIHLVWALAALSWPLMARVVRAQVRSLQRQEFVLAARVTGAGTLYIVRRHILPHVAMTIGAIASMDYAGFLVALSSYSFLGFGVQSPTPEWGAMLAEGRFYMDAAPLMVVAPGAAITLAVFLSLKVSYWFSGRPPQPSALR